MDSDLGSDYEEHIADLFDEQCLIDTTRPEYLHLATHKPEISRDDKTAKGCHKTIAYACDPVPKPGNVLQKGKPRRACPIPKARLPACTVTKKEENPGPMEALDAQWETGQGGTYPCPPEADVCPEPLKQGAIPKSKNFLALNKMDVSRPRPKQNKIKFVDKNNGDKQLGLVPRYIYKKDYGKVPAYSSASSGRDSQPDPEAMYQEFVEWAAQVKESRHLGVLKQLRCELQKQYMSLPIVMDTLAQRLRRNRLERHLRRLEDEIMILERKKNVV